MIPRLLYGVVLGIAFLCYSGCDVLHSGAAPSIEFTVVPPAGVGGSAKTEKIAGRVVGAKSEQRIVLFAKSGMWWVQPLTERPFTEINADSTWTGITHLGTEYAALLVGSRYVPPKTADVLPSKGGQVMAVAIVKGKPHENAPETPKRLLFSGYDWEVRQIPSDSGGTRHENRASNAWTDQMGRLHLRIAREGNEWTCAEVHLLRSLGYGSYSFLVNQLTVPDANTVFSMFTWDELEAGQSHREVDVELSQWGNPAAKNAQFTIQPYYVPANVVRFNFPFKPGTHSFRWEPGRVSFKSTETNSKRIVAEHVFTSGVPSPGGEKVHINLYLYGRDRAPRQKGVEVVIEKFEYLP